MKYAVEQRLKFIDFLVSHYGSINRSALVDYYGISIPQASLDLRDYMKLAPSNLIYDKVLKTYTRASTFVRVWS